MKTTHGSNTVGRQAADEENLIGLLLRAQKENKPLASGKPRKASRESFSRFVERTQGPLARRVLNKVRGDLNQCEDLVQETYMKVWKDLSRFDPAKLGRGGVLGWLLRIAVNTAISFGRRKRPSVGLETAGSSADNEWTGFPEPACPEPGPAEKAHANVVAARLDEAVASLREDKQVILKMHYLDDLSHKDIARLTGLSLGQVNMKLFSARQEVRAKLESVVNQRD